jgi:hypothetical protein
MYSYDHVEEMITIPLNKTVSILNERKIITTDNKQAWNLYHIISDALYDTSTILLRSYSKELHSRKQEEIRESLVFWENQRNKDRNEESKSEESRSAGPASPLKRKDGAEKIDTGDSVKIYNSDCSGKGSMKSKSDEGSDEPKEEVS